MVELRATKGDRRPKVPTGLKPASDGLRADRQELNNRLQGWKYVSPDRYPLECLLNPLSLTVDYRR